ncbi:MAG: SGNH/GDSL hydrolase family protein [Proteobacteria bacterium]|nr:SGNH/GDSL hydrolase family protein [Pseudomonadota bacterium]
MSNKNKENLMINYRLLIFLYSVITISIVSVISCTHQKKMVTPVKIWGRTSILMIGDSITEGVQSNPSAEPYTAVAAKILGKGFTVTQVGCGGATTWDWSSFGGVTLCGGQFWDLNVYEARARPNLPADVVTVMLGTNDATGFFEPAPISPNEYRDNLANLVTNLLNDGAGQVMLMTPPPMCESTNPDVVMRLEAYRTIVEAMCSTRKGVVCGPDVYTLLTEDDFQGCDPHPNGLGHLTLGIAVAMMILGQ